MKEKMIILKDPVLVERNKDDKDTDNKVSEVKVIDETDNDKVIIIKDKI